MTEEEIEKQAKLEYMKNKNWIDGAKWGMEHAIEWHDLRKDPNDLPKEDCETVTLHENGNKNIIKWKHGEWTDAIVIPVIAWCELPTYKG